MKKLSIITIAAVGLSCFCSPGYAQPPTQVSPTSTSGQAGQVQCGTDEYMKQHPHLMKKVEEIYRQILENSDKGATNKTMGVIKYVPLVVHVVHENGPENLSLAQVQAAIQKMNDDYNWATLGNGGVDTEIQFFLAKIDPNGDCTEGVTWTYSPDYTNSSKWPYRRKVQDLIKWDPDKYLNIWVTKNPGAVGQASFGGVAMADGGYVWVRYDYFSSTKTTPAHEVGHWLGLFHTFMGGCAGMTPGDCATGGDQVCDTPPCTSTTGCTPSNTCFESSDLPDMLNNFLSYNSCRDAFTQGQKDRMHNYLTNRPNLYSAANLDATGFTGNTSTSGWSMSAFSADFKDGTNGTTTSFSSLLSNITASNVDYTITLTANQPADWSASFVIDANPYTNTAVITFPASTSKNISIDVEPGPTPAIADYSLTMIPAGNACGTSLNFKVIANVTDMIITNDGAFGNNGSYDWTSYYQNGLNSAGNSNHTYTAPGTFVEGINNGAMSDVNNIYFNVGWSYPSFTDENVAALSTFLDNGGNLFISGQDIGWETWESSHNTPSINTQNFYTNYLQTTYLADGSTANTPLTANTSDAVFGTVSNSGISDVYGNNKVIPDELQPATANASAIFYYDNNTAKIGGIRVNNGIYKVVYLGVGIEMLADTNVSSQIVKLSHDWFYSGDVGTEELDNGLGNLWLGQNYPNPADEYTIIPVISREQESKIELIDVLGRVVISKSIKPGANRVNINTSQLNEGIYFYRIVGGELAPDLSQGLMTRSMGVIH